MFYRLWNFIYDQFLAVIFYYATTIAMAIPIVALGQMSIFQK